MSVPYCCDFTLCFPHFSLAVWKRPTARNTAHTVQRATQSYRRARTPWRFRMWLWYVTWGPWPPHCLSLCFGFASVGPFIGQVMWQMRSSTLLPDFSEVCATAGNAMVQVNIGLARGDFQTFQHGCILGTRHSRLKYAL